MKICKKCKDVVNTVSMSGNSGMCKSCRRAYDRAYYVANHSKIRVQRKSSAKSLTDRNRQFVLDYLNQNPCIDCGITDVRVLEFDHLDVELKTSNISEMIFKCSLEKIKEEIAKCSVRCANCHRIKTFEQFGYWKSNIMPL